MVNTAANGAILSPDGLYRYRLWRRWSFMFDGRPPALFIMLNPSTATAEVDDPTIRRCIGFAKAWRCDGLIVCNLFAWRATKPTAMKAHGGAAIGPENDAQILAALADANPDYIICAWGTHGHFLDRDKAVLDLLRHAGATPKALSFTSDKTPGHPLYLRADSQPVPMP